MYLISKKLARGLRKFYNSCQLCYVQRLLEIGEEFLQILAGHAHFIAGVLDGAVLELDEFGQLVQRQFIDSVFHILLQDKFHEGNLLFGYFVQDFFVHQADSLSAFHGAFVVSDEFQHIKQVAFFVLGGGAP